MLPRHKYSNLLPAPVQKNESSSVVGSSKPAINNRGPSRQSNPPSSFPKQNDDENHATICQKIENLWRNPYQYADNMRRGTQSATVVRHHNPAPSSNRRESKLVQFSLYT